MITLADASADDAPLIPPKIHDSYNKDIDMRRLERQLRVLPDLLNSCPDIASKVTRVRTLANMVAAAPLASSMFSEVDKLVRIYLTIPVTTATGERSFSAVWSRTLLRVGVEVSLVWSRTLWKVLGLMHQNLYLRSTMSRQRLNNIMPLSVHKDLMDGLDLSTIVRHSWMPMNAAGISLALCTVHNETHQSDWG